MINCIFGALGKLLLTLALALPCFCQSVLWQKDSTEPRVQLMGEDFQIESNGNYFTSHTPARTLSQCGALGADLGFPVVYPDKILFLFGDTLSVYSTTTETGPQYFLSPGSGGDDSIGYIPNIDLNQCHYIAEVDKQLAAGNTKPSVDLSSCPAMQLFVNPNHGPQDHIFQATTISGLQSGEGLGPFQTPSGGVDYNNQLYMFYITRVQDAQPHFALESIVARADQPSSALSTTTPPTFTRLYTVSTHPTVADPSNPPSETDANGKFMFNPLLVMDHETLAGNALSPGLPPALQSASQVVFVFGSSWQYNRSNLYLAAFSLSDIASGTAKWFYYAGQKGGENIWSSDEKAATPLLPGSPNVGNHTVMWSGELQRFLLMYGNIVARGSATPWGPWSDAVKVFDPQGAWAKKLIHHPGADMITRSVVPIYNAKTDMLANLNNGDTGFPYGPNLIDKFTKNSDGSVTAFFTMSTWNPYEVFLSSTTFSIGPLPAPVISAASFDGSSVSPGSIATMYGNGFSDTTEAASTVPLPTSLAGRTVVVQDSHGALWPAQLYFVSSGQINFVVPSQASLGQATVRVMSQSALVYSATTNLTAVAPALFATLARGTPPAAALVQTFDGDGKSTVQFTFTCGHTPDSCVTKPIDLSNAAGGAFLELFGTGVRMLPGLPAATAAIGGVPAPVKFAGPQSQFPGLDQVNIEIPQQQLKGRGDVDVTLLVGGKAANTVRVAFK